MKWSENHLKVLKSAMKWSDRKCSAKCSVGKGWKRSAIGRYIWVVKLWEARDWCNKRVCIMVAKTLETIYNTFFNWCCIPYVHFWELYLSCKYCCKLICICCILCLFVVNVCVFVVILCVFVLSDVYLLYLMCTCCTSYVYLLYCMYCCSYFRCRTAG